MFRLIVRAVFVAAIVLIPASLRGEMLTDELIGYWQFDGDGRDASGGGRDVELIGDPGFAEGLFGQALDLHDDPSQYAQRPIDDPLYDFGSGDFTVQTWVNLNDLSHEQVFIEKFERSGGPGWTVTMMGPPSRLVCHFYASPSVVMHSTVRPALETDMWHHLVVRRGGDAFEIFYDGVSIAGRSDPDPVPDTSFPLLIGRRNEKDGRGFAVDGRIDEVAIWRRTLNDEEIAALYNGGNGLLLVPEPATALLMGIGLVTLWGWGRAQRRRSRCTELE